MLSPHYKIKPIEKSDITHVVEIHSASFKDFFLTHLGFDFLSVYYSAFQKAHEGIMFGCFENEKLIGFSAATEQSSGFNTKLIISNLPAFSLLAIKILTTNPKALIRLYHNSKKVNDVRDKGLYAELFSIAVSPVAQKSGVGKLLLESLELELRKRQCKELTLTTDCENNEQALTFYNKMGYQIMYEFKAYPERKMFRLTKKLQ